MMWRQRKGIAFGTFLAAALLLGATSLVLAQPKEFTPPHSRPGPAAERIRFQAFHVDVAPRELQAGRMDLYEYSLKSEAASALKGTPGVQIYQAPATTLSLVLNPAPAPPGELNPFSIREVRFALQYAINREFIAREIFKGMAQPMLSYVSPSDYDSLTVSDLLREFNITYDPESAKEMVTKAMTEAGAVLQDGVWHYRGKPIQIKLIARVEDERRVIGDTVRAELERLGFSVVPTYHQFAPAILTVYGSDPALLQWHIYTEGWSRGAAERYDYATANQMAAPWLGNMPGWREIGFWQYESPKLDDLGQRLFRGDFKNIQERDDLYREITRLSLEESVRIWVATTMNSFPAVANLEGVTEDLVAGPKSLWTLREAHLPEKDTLTVGNLWVWTERTTWNPVGGFGDAYSVDIWRNLYDPPIWRHPFTGLPIAMRARFDIETAGPTGKLTIPSDAFRWDAERKEFRPLETGAQATSKVIFDYSRYLQSNWQHGQQITLADILYSIYQAFDMTYNPDKSRIEFARAATSRPYLETLRAFRIVGDNKLEVYVDFWHFIPEYIAEYANVGGLAMPWEILAAMDNLVFTARRAAYSDTAAQRFGVPWLSLVIDSDVRLVRRTLQEFQEQERLPENVFRIGGRSLVSREEALQRYAAAISWIDRYGLAVISNGPFKLVRFDRPAQFAELEAFRDPSYPFKPGDWYFGAAPRISFTEAEAQPIVTGEEARVRIALEGPGKLSLRYTLYDPVGGRVIQQGTAQETAPGTFAIAWGRQQTSTLPPGPYQMFLTAVSDSLASPSEIKLDLQVAATRQELERLAPGAFAPAAQTGLSPLAIAGIALGVLALLFIVSLVTFVLARQTRRPS